MKPVSSKPIEKEPKKIFLREKKDDPFKMPSDSVIISGKEKEDFVLIPSKIDGVTVNNKLTEGAGIKEKNNPYKFSSKYTIKDIMTDPVKAKAFATEYLAGENAYFSIARDEKTQLMYDGYNLHEDTGLIKDVRFWSAPSKESLDLGICIKALGGDEKAALVVSKNNPSDAKKIAADILKKKMDSYMKFYKENPGYGGFLPWVYVDGEIRPAKGWEGQLPGLDNGEWVWSVLAAEKALRKAGFKDIADHYGKYGDILKSKLTDIFYDKEAGKIRADVKVVSPESPDSKYETQIDVPGKCAYLSDFHEGLMLILSVLLLGKDMPEKEVERVWKNVDTKRVETKYGTTWEAWCGSTHESWAYLFLPYRDIPNYKDLFRIREKIRTQNSAARQYPGRAASTNEPGGNGYLSACGIEGIGTMEPEHNDVFATYGAFGLLFEFSDKPAQGNYGLAWLLNMLKANKMQGPLGGGESATNDGKKACCVKTVDGTFPNLLAMMGGIEKETSEMMKDYGIYDKFKGLMESKYKEAFGSKPLKENCDFALPSVSVPTDVSEDFSVKNSLSNQEKS